MKDVITVQGLDSVAYALRNLFPKSEADGILRRVLTARGKPIAAAAAARAPQLTGELRRSITVSTKLSKRQRSIHKKVDPGDVEVFVGAGAIPQAHLTEYGTSREKAQPFMRPAWDQARVAILKDLASDLWNEIAARAARGSR